MGVGRNIPRKTATGAFTKGVKEIVEKTKAETKAQKAAKPKESADAQHGRFLEMAKEVGAEKKPDKFLRAFRKFTGR